MRRLLLAAALSAVVLVATLAATVYALNVRGEAALDAAASVAGDAPSAASAASSAALIAHGAYLARAGNCQGCHTDTNAATGSAAYAGGRGVPTPFGTVYAPNLTPDPSTGIGAWSAAEFWRALHHGRSRDGRLLYPAFPYPNYTRVTRADSDALHAYLRSLPAVVQPNRAHALRFPFNQQAALAVWRALYFRAAGLTDDLSGMVDLVDRADRANLAEPADPSHRANPARSAEWQRGAYLVEGLGHCNACHASRNALGAPAGPLDLAGGLIPVQNWYAPSLASAAEAGVAEWDTQAVVDLLQTGVASPGGKRVAVAGPMSEVVSSGTQHLTQPDLRAMATYLKALPQAAVAHAAATVAAPAPASPSVPGAATTSEADTPGARLYEQHCAACHGAHGEGAPGIYPALAGNRALSLPTPANLVHLVIEGGFAPATAGNPRPFGMPPFATVLSDAEVAQVLSHIRASWGNRAAPVSALEVARFRGAR